MTIFAVDDERLALEGLSEAILEAASGAELHTFMCPEDALLQAVTLNPDIVFLDIKMGTANGIDTAKKLKEALPTLNIIFVSGYSQYSLEAFSVYASGYILKPATKESIEKELQNLRFPGTKRKVRIQTFGNFEIFVNDTPISFARSKSKEVLAYLVDRNGSVVSRKEIASVLWADRYYSRSVQQHLQVLIREMIVSLKQVGIEDIIVHTSNGFCLDKTKVDCDFFKFLEQKTNRPRFLGEYMSNYTWAENTSGSLYYFEQKKK